MATIFREGEMDDSIILNVTAEVIRDRQYLVVLTPALYVAPFPPDLAAITSPAVGLFFTNEKPLFLNLGMIHSLWAKDMFIARCENCGSICPMFSLEVANVQRNRWWGVCLDC